MFKKFFLFGFLLFYNSVAAQAAYKTEIAHLLEYVKTTECKYIRNGDVHSFGELSPKDISLLIILVTICNI